MSERFTQSQVDRYNAKMAEKNAVGLSDPGAKIGVDRESELHEQIFSECRRRGWIALHGAMSERTHRNSGEEDFQIKADKGRHFSIECKSRSGKLSPAQQAMHHQAERLGHKIHVCRSYEDFLKIVDA